MRDRATSKIGSAALGIYRGGKGEAPGKIGGQGGHAIGSSNNAEDARGATLSNLHDAACVQILSVVLDDDNLLVLSLVCRRWSEVVRREEVWEDKYIFIGERNLSRKWLRAWYPRWRRGTVEMTHGEKDELVGANEQRHVIYHPWLHTFGRESWPWTTVVIRGTPYAVCLTRFRGPLDAQVFQDLSPRRIPDVIVVGWTNAMNHDEYGRMVTRARTGNPMVGDVLAGTTLWPVGRFESEYGVDFEDLRRPPLCFSEHDPWIGKLRLNPEQQSLTVETLLNEEKTLRLLGARLPLDRALKLFVAVAMTAPEEIADLPAVHLGDSFIEPE